MGAIGNNSQVEFDAYIIPTNELTREIFRLLDVDTRIIVPFNIHVRILISSADVLCPSPVSPLRVIPDGIASSHSNPLWNRTILFQLFSQLGLNTEVLWALMVDPVNSMFNRKSPC